MENEEDPDIVRNHPTYQRASRRADALRNQPEKLMKLVAEATRLSRQKMPRRFEEINTSLAALFRMVKAYARREYTEIPWASIALIVTSLIYFVTPLDLIPDFLPFLGFGDDVAILAWTISQIRGDIERFTEWEKSKEIETP